jgi:hypothetical protein
MNFVIIVISLFVQIIFIYKREWLFDKKIFIGVVIVSVLLFGASMALTAQGMGNPKFIPALKMPFLVVLIFFIMKTMFFRIYERNAEDTFWSMNLSLMRDGVFNFLFWFLGIMIPAFLIYYVKV